MEDENIRKKTKFKRFISVDQVIFICCLQISAFYHGCYRSSLFKYSDIGNYELEPIEMGVAMVFLGSIVVGAPVAAAKWMIQEIRNK